VNRLSKLRSAFAMPLFVLFCVPVIAATYLIANAVVSRMPRADFPT